MAGPLSVPFGVRIVVIALLEVLKLYARHKVNSDASFSPTVKTALNTLLDATDEIAALNPIGPE